MDVQSLVSLNVYIKRVLIKSFVEEIECKIKTYGSSEFYSMENAKLIL